MTTAEPHDGQGTTRQARYSAVVKFRPQEQFRITCPYSSKQAGSGGGVLVGYESGSLAFVGSDSILIP